MQRKNYFSRINKPNFPYLVFFFIIQLTEDLEKRKNVQYFVPMVTCFIYFSFITIQ